MKILCLGHATYDTTLPVDIYPEENQKYRTEDKIECGGGPASNAAYLLAKWGLDVTFAGAVGNDIYGEKVIEEFKKIGVNTSYIERSGENTSSGYIIANLQNGSRTIITAATPKIIKLKNEINENYDFILLDGEHLESAKEVLEKNPQAVSILDAGTLKESTKELGSKVTYLACSKVFAEDFSEEEFKEDKSNWIQIYKKLEKYFQTKIIITLEDKGSMIKYNNEYLIIPSIKVKALDSTGAGDIFHGALAYFLINNYTLDKAVSLANITGALSVEKIGSRYAMPELENVIDLGKKYGVL